MIGNAATVALCCLALLAASVAGAPNRRLLIPGGNSVTDESGNRFYSNPAQKPPSEGCTDVAPDDRYTCDQQKSFGSCDRSFMKDNNYCLYTCGRCESVGQGGGGGEGGGDEGPSPTSNPSQINETTCTDVPPNNEYNCTQQFTFGKCVAPYMIKGNFCARTCGRPPCPPVENVPVAPKYAANATTATTATTTATVTAPGANITVPAPAVVTPAVEAPGVTVTPPVVPAPTATEAVTPVVLTDNMTVAPEAPSPVPVPPAVEATPPAAATVTTPPLPAPEQLPAVNVTEPAVNVAAPEVTATEPTVNVTAPPAPAQALPALATTPPAANMPSNMTITGANITVLNTTAPAAAP